MSKVTTWTIMTMNTDQGTVAITSKVRETAESALAHVQAMDQCAPGIEPVYVVPAGGWRWTWEYVSHGVRCTDTVRIY